MRLHDPLGMRPISAIITDLPCITKLFPTDLNYSFVGINLGNTVSDFECLGINFGLPFPASEIQKSFLINNYGIAVADF